LTTLDGDDATEVGTPLRLCCYVGSDELGGMEMSVATLLAGLDDSFDVTIMGVSTLVVEMLTRGRPTARSMIVPAVQNKLDIRSIVAHVRALRELRPDLLLANLAQLYDAQYAMLAAQLNRVPTVAVAHCVLPAASSSQRLSFNFLFRRVQALGGVSRSVCAQVEEALARSPGSVALLYNGVPDCEARLEANATDGIAAGKFVVGAVGRLVHEKGFDVLIRALPKLEDVHLVVVGDGPERQNLEHLGESLGMDDRITFAGWSDAPWTSQWRFDALAVPSRVEGFGLVAVEGLLAEVPVVASKVGGLTEVLQDGTTGVLVPVDDPTARADALRALQHDPDLQVRLARDGRRDARERFSVEAMVRAYERFFVEPGHTRAERARQKLC